MVALTVEMYRDGVWKETRTRVWPRVAVDEDGCILVTFDVGYLQPPWRVKTKDRDGVVLFERTR